MKKQKKPSFTKASEGKEEKKPIEKLKRKLAEYQKLKDEYLAGWQRERADFLNYKKGELERVGELTKYADTELILKFLPILDNFDLAEKKIPKDLKNSENVKGLLQIKSQIKDFLKDQGVEEIESLGKKFDSSLQEIVEIVETKDKKSGAVIVIEEIQKGYKVIEEVQKGYKIHGQLLRQAKVKVKEIKTT